MIKRKTYSVSMPAAHKLGQLSLAMSEGADMTVSRQDILDAAVEIVHAPAMHKKLLKIIARNKKV